MLHRITPLLLCSLTLAACAGADESQAGAGAAASEQAAPSPDEAALEQIRAAYVEHYNQHHATQLADLYSDSAYVLAADMGVQEGRAEVQAALEAELAGQPTIGLTTKASRIFGDHAVALGEYTVTPAAGAGSGPISGTYLTVFNRENGNWKIGGLITNLNAAPPEGFKLAGGDEKEPPDNGRMKELLEPYTRAFNSSDWAALAGMYTADAQVAYSAAPLIQGTAAIQQRYEERFGATAAPKIQIHDVGTLELSPDWAVDGGWFHLEASPGGQAFTQDGMYLNLVQRQADGTWKIHWSVVNGYPKPASPKPGA